METPPRVDLEQARDIPTSSSQGIYQRPAISKENTTGIPPAPSVRGSAGPGPPTNVTAQGNLLQSPARRLPAGTSPHHSSGLGRAASRPARQQKLQFVECSGGHFSDQSSSWWLTAGSESCPPYGQSHLVPLATRTWHTVLSTFEKMYLLPLLCAFIY